MYKKLFLVLLLCLMFLPFQNVSAQEADNKAVNLYFFWGNGCPHCEKEKPFLDKMSAKYPQLKINSYEIWNNADNRQLMIEFSKKLNANVSGVPFTVIGEHYVIGWLDEKNTGAQIEEAINCAINTECRDVGSELNGAQIDPKEDSGDPTFESPIPETITVPIFGEIKTKNLSLPFFTILLGALDGFNPCAMWTLLFLISLLLGMENKKKMWILGSTFIAASALVYFIFMAAWLNLLLFIGFILWIRIIVGLVALVGGSYNLKEFFTNKDATCKVTNSEKKQQVFEKLKSLTHQKSFYLALGGIILLAFAVNLVELICSAGLPVIFTQILALSNLANWQYYAYMLLYIFVFMLDDLIIFFVAMTTLQMTGVTTKYTRASHLIGGVLMIIIGLLLIFRPEWLMLG